MPVIPPSNLTEPLLDGPEVSSAIYGPAGTTLERLNGGLDSNNYAGGAGSIRASAIQPGTFASGRTLQSDDWEITYAMQMSSQSSGTAEANRLQLARIGARFFLPYTVRFLLIHYEGYFRHDCSLWDTGVTNQEEFWDLRFVLDTTRIPAALAMLPYGNRLAGLPPFAGGVDQMPSYRWRYVTKSLPVFSSTFVQKGWHSFQLTLWCKPFAGSDDQCKLKAILPTSSVSVIAIR